MKTPDRTLTLIHFLMAMLLVTGLQARTWTSKDGNRTFDAEFKSYDADGETFTVLMSNGTLKTFKQDILSEDDIRFLKSQGAGAVKDLPEELPDPDGEEVFADVAYQPGTDTLTLTPVQPLSSGTQYTATIEPQTDGKTVE